MTPSKPYCPISKLLYSPARCKRVVRRKSLLKVVRPSMTQVDRPRTPQAFLSRWSSKRNKLCWLISQTLHIKRTMTVMMTWPICSTSEMSLLRSNSSHLHECLLISISLSTQQTRICKNSTRVSSRSSMKLSMKLHSHKALSRTNSLSNLCTSHSSSTFNK